MVTMRRTGHTRTKKKPSSKRGNNRTAYKNAKNNAKRAVARTKASSQDYFYTKNDRNIFKTAKQRDDNSNNTKAIKYIKKRRRSIAHIKRGHRNKMERILLPTF